MDGVREPSGKLSRSGNEPADVIALDARRRHFCLTPDQAKDQLAVSFIGRLRLRGELSENQFKAAETFIALNNDMRKAIGSPAALYEGSGGAGGDDGVAQVEWKQKVMQRFAAVSYAIHEAQRADRFNNLVLAIDACILEDKEAPEMAGTIRLACNVLDRHFSLDSAKR